MSASTAYVKVIKTITRLTKIAEAVRQADGLGSEAREELLGRLGGALDDVLRRASSQDAPGALEN